MRFSSSDPYSISVIVIGYNIEKYIERCLISVFNQTYGNYEVIFVNDGSIDKTILIANSIDNKDIPFTIIDKENGGIISARKAGVRKAIGNYIIFVDGDDSIRSNMLSDFINSIKMNRNEYDIVVADYYEERPGDIWILKQNNYPYGEMQSDDYVKGILDGTFYHFMVAKLYRRNFIVEKEYDRFPNITIAEDLFTNSILGVYLPKVLYINSAAYNYHFNNISVTRDGKLEIVDKQLETLKILNESLRSISGEKYNEYINYQWYLFAFGYIQIKFSPKFKRYLVNKCKPYMKNIRKNVLYKNQKRDLSLYYGRILLFMYIYFFVFAGPFDAFCNAFIHILRKYKILKYY